IALPRFCYSEFLLPNPLPLANDVPKEAHGLVNRDKPAQSPPLLADASSAKYPPLDLPEPPRAIYHAKNANSHLATPKWQNWHTSPATYPNRHLAPVGA